MTVTQSRVIFKVTNAIKVHMLVLVHVVVCTGWFDQETGEKADRE